MRCFTTETWREGASWLGIPGIRQRSAEGLRRDSPGDTVTGADVHACGGVVCCKARLHRHRRLDHTLIITEAFRSQWRDLRATTPRDRTSSSHGVNGKISHGGGEYEGGERGGPHHGGKCGVSSHFIFQTRSTVL